MAITLYYRIQKAEAKTGPVAAKTARDIMLKEWRNPPHWHLDSVSETDNFWGVSFSIVPENKEEYHSQEDRRVAQDFDFDPGT